MENGYAVILRKWKKGDTVELDFPMDVRRVEARSEVEDDRGKAAIERGPIDLLHRRQRPAGQFDFQQIHSYRDDDFRHLRPGYA